MYRNVGWICKKKREKERRQHMHATKVRMTLYHLKYQALYRSQKKYNDNSMYISVKGQESSNGFVIF